VKIKWNNFMMIILSKNLKEKIFFDYSKDLIQTCERQATLKIKFSRQAFKTKL
jgi:hypothetical protein